MARTVASTVVATPEELSRPTPARPGRSRRRQRQSAPVADLMTDGRASPRRRTPARRDCSARSIASPVAQGTWSLTDPARTVARRIGSPRRADTPLRDRRLAAGDAQPRVSRPWQRASTTRWSSWVAKLGAGSAAAANETDPTREPPDEVVERPPDFVAPIELEAGIVLPPVQQYALIENALAAARGARAGPRSGTRSPRSGPVSTPWRPTTPTLPSARRALRPRSPCPVHTTARSRTPTTSGTPVSGPWTSPSALVICSAARAAEAGVPAGPMALPARSRSTARRRSR